MKQLMQRLTGAVRLALGALCATAAWGETVDCSTWAAVKSNLEAGNSVKLTADVSVSGQGQGVWVDGAVAAEVTLDLNGHTVDGPSGAGQGGERDRLFVLVGSSVYKLTIVDTVGGGGFVGHQSGTYQGGFAYVRDRCQLIIDNGTISYFSTTEHGGAITVSGQDAAFTMNGGTIRNCSSSRCGGAIYCENGARCTMNGGTVMNCSASSDGGAIYCLGCVLTLKNGTISGNAGSGGGAVCCCGSSGTATFENMNFSGNKAQQGYGGAINFGNSGGTYELRDCAITGNSAATSGGALSIGGGCKVSVYDCTITGNTSGSGYGALHLNNFDGNSADIYGAVVSGNSPADFNVEKANAFTVRGGVYDTNPAGASNLGIASGYASTQVGSKWVVGHDVAYDADSHLTGGTYTFDPSKDEYDACGCHVASNRVMLQRGSGTNATWTIRVASSGSILASEWRDAKTVLEAGYDVKLVADVAQDDEQSQVQLVRAGRRVMLDLNGHVVTCYDNSRLADVCVTSGEGATFTLKDSVGKGFVTGGSCENGGCVWVGAGNAFVLEGVRIEKCTASNGGGAIYCEGGAVTLRNGAISWCSAGHGGAVHFNGSSGTVTFENMTLAGNEAKSGYGGAINFGNSGGTYELRSCTITANSASASGGAMSIGGNVHVSVYDCTIGGNAAAGNNSEDGCGAIHLNTFDGNSAHVYGAFVSGNSPADFHIQKSDAFTVHGGVYDTDPSGASHLVMASDYAATPVGSNWVVGRNVAHDADNRLTGGTYTFCPTNAAYVIAGLSVRGTVKVEEQETEPKTWLLCDMPIPAVPSPVAHATAIVYTNGVLSAETAAGSGQWHVWSNETATVVYTADDGYVFAGGATVVTNDLDTTVNPAVNAGNPPEALVRVAYVDEHGEPQTADAHIVVASSSRVTWSAGWHVVQGDVTITGGVQVNGAVKLILADGATLTIGDVADDDAGIGVSGDGHSFTVYGQVRGTGCLDVTGGDWAAGIGGGYVGNGANVTINGGRVTATGGYWAAAIGGGGCGDGSDIAINGGTVTAVGGSFAAGIGGGCGGAGADITIGDATVFVGSPGVTYDGGDYVADLIGNGCDSDESAEGVSIAATARVFFNLTGWHDDDLGVWTEPMAAMPDSCERLVVMTSSTPVGCTLVAGVGSWTAGAAFALTNAATGATGSLSVNDPDGATFAGKLLKLPFENGKLSLAVETVGTYPDYLSQYSDAVRARFDAWATTFGSRDPGGAYRNAFLLNVATNREEEAEEAFAFASVVVTNGVVDVVLPAPLPPATNFNGAVWLQCATNLPAEWHDVESGSYIDEKGSFLRCLIDFEHTLTPGTFPTKPTGTKTIKVLVR